MENLARAKASTGAVVLAAGQSRRMPGRNKLLTQIDGRALIAQTLASVKSVGLADVVVVTGHEEQVLKDIAERTGCRAVFNPKYEDGMGTSIATGLSALDETIAAAFVCLGDMPFIQPTTFDSLLSAFYSQSDNNEQIAVPVFNEQRGHPVLFGRGTFQHLATLTGDRGAKDLLIRKPDRLIHANVDDPGIHLDIDTPEDAANVVKTNR